MKPLHLLYAEDNAQDADMTRAHFEQEAADFHLEIADTGARCLERLAAGAFDLLLLDNHLPDMDGLDVLAQIRTRGFTLPVVMVTGAGDDELVAKALRAGAADYVPKSGDYLATLPGILRGLSARQRRRQTVNADEAQRPRQILYVEPHAMDAEMTAEHFATAAPHLNLRVVPSCLEALALLETGGIFDLVLSDLRMPGMNALEFLRELRHRGIELPFIVITGRGDETTAVAILRLGASDYLVKRDNYLTQLPHAIDHALHRFLLDQSIHRLYGELQTANQSLEERVRERTAELLHEITERKRAGEAMKHMQNLLSEGQRIAHLGSWEYIAATQETVWSDEEKRIYGLDPSEPSPSYQEMLRRHVHSEDAAALDRSFREALQNSSVFENENRIVWPDGSVRHIFNRAHPYFDDAGKLLSYIGTTLDITERKRSAAALAVSEERLRLAVEGASLGTWHWDIRSGELTWSNRCLAIFGIPAGTRMSYEKFLAALHPEDRARADAAVQQALKHRSEYDIELRTVWPDGTTHWAASKGRACYNEAGEPVRMEGLAFDITERKQAEETLRELKDRLAAMIEHQPECVKVLDAQGRLVSMNPAGLAMLEVGSLAEAQRGSLKDFIAPEYRAAFRDLHQRVMAGGHGELEFEVIGQNGTRRWLDTHAAPLRDATGKVHLLLGITRDITERKQAEEALRDSEALLRSIADQTNDMIFVKDCESRIQFINPAGARLSGLPLEKILGHSDPEIHSDPRQADAFLASDRRVMQSQRAETVEEEFKSATGRRVILLTTKSPRFDAQGNVIGLVGIARDITELKQSERQRLRTQRLEAIGTLASGVAHDLNNALAPILMGVELLKMQYPEKSSILETFETSAKRGADMVRQLLGFAKGAEGARVRLNVLHLIKEMEKLMKGTFPKNIQLVFKRDPKLPAVLGDATQLHQVLLNLCVNARDAMPQGGTLNLEAQRLEVDASYASSVPDAKPGQYLALRVRDTGTGIPPEILDRIFDPFFTTKGPDKGTGLGLSTVMGIVKGHGGFLHVYSQPGQGSTFTVYLPADHAGSDTERATQAAVEFRGQGETILLLDDEPGVREVAGEVLRRLNFNPLTATDGADGLIQAAQHRAELRAIITDLHMPHMDGLMFVRSVRRMLPDIPIVVASGRLDDAVAGEFKELGVTSRLDKPFTEAQLAETLKNLLAPK